MMMLMAPFLSFLTLLAEASSAASNNLTICPLLGQQYPPPVQLASNSAFQAATKKIENALISLGKEVSLNTTSLSLSIWASHLFNEINRFFYDATIRVSKIPTTPMEPLKQFDTHADLLSTLFSRFSTTEDDLLYQYHHTDALLASSKQGTNKLDADSIYRIGSISKLFTMYMMLISDGDRHFNDPIAEHISALQRDSSNWNTITPDWSEITIGDLAGQMGGLLRDYGYGDLAVKGQLAGLPASIKSAFPKVPTNEVPKCGYVDGTTYTTCSVGEFLKGVTSESPIFPTAYTPAYSNEAFALIGLALQSIVNKDPEDIFNSAIVDALALDSTLYATPKTIPDTAVIPGTPSLSGWDADLGVIIPAAGYFSSTNDLATIGKAILNSTLMSQAQTNRWLKPSSFVESFNQGVGRPWEIFRTHVNGQAIDMYAKGGDWLSYSSLFALIPQYDFGFTILTASDPGVPVPGGPLVRTYFPQTILEILLPVLDGIAKEQAESNFGGTYVDSATNSSITLTTDSSNSGLQVTSWISEGVDVFELISAAAPSPVYRLQPNHIDYGKNKIGFTSFYTSAAPISDTGLTKCPGWDQVDSIPDGNIPLGQMVFDVSDGVATAVELRALRMILEKKA